MSKPIHLVWREIEFQKNKHVYSVFLFGFVEAMSTLIRFRVKTHIFISVLAFHPHSDGVFVKRKRRKTLSNFHFRVVVWTVIMEAYENDDAC